MVFCVAFSVPKSLFEISKTTLRKNLNFFTIREVPYGPKVTRRRKRGKKKFKKNLKDCTKWNRKMGGRSLVITFGVFPV